MIQNDRQRKITMGWLARFRESAGRLRERLDEGDDDARGLRRIELAALRGEIEALESQLSEYVELRAGRAQSLSFVSLDELPKALIAGGVSQDDLAGRLDMDREAFERAEANDYESFSLSHLLEVVRLVGVDVSGSLRLPEGAGQPAA